MDESAAPPPAHPTPQEKDRIVFARLAAPFPGKAISWRPGQTTKDKKKAQALAYVDARDVQTRLEEVLGFDWDIEHYGIGTDHVCCRIVITLPSGKKVSRTNGCWVGNVEVSANGGKVESKEEDRADREAKWALSDAFKRSATMFGVAKYLYEMPHPYMPINEFSKFSDESLEYLAKIAAKPYDEWQAARQRRAAEAARGQAPANQTKRPAAAPKTTDKGLGPSASPEQPPPQGEPPPPAQTAASDGAPATSPGPVTDDYVGSPGDDSFLGKLRREAAALKNKAAFDEFLTRTRETYADGTEEKRVYAAFVREAATRIGIKPKAAAPPPPSTTP